MLTSRTLQKFSLLRLLTLFIVAVLLAGGITGCARQGHPSEEALAPKQEPRQTGGPETAGLTTPPAEERGMPTAGPATSEGAPASALPPKPSVATSTHCYRTASGGGTRSSGKGGQKGKKSAGRCEPQSLPFARCRSGIDTCKLGNTGPLAWFACEKKHGNTGDIPRQGGILILDANSRRGMPTGHPVYVEKVVPEAPDTWGLILSHTNYDRRCSLETNVEARYRRKAKSVDFLTGAWKAWGQGLKVAGFILD